jgi:hypothetical protein
VHAGGTQVPVKLLDRSIVRQTRAESKPFCSARGMGPRCCLCAMTFLASIPWQIKVVQGTHAQPEDWKRCLASLPSSPPPPAICWRAFAPAFSDKTPRLERPAAQDTHRLTMQVDVARRCHTRPQDSPTWRVPCAAKFGSFLSRVIDRACRRGSLHASIQDFACTYRTGSAIHVMLADHGSCVIL